MNKRYFTSESVTEGHPDKLCDTIADAILDELLKGDAFTRSACEVCATTNTVLVMGEITSQTKINVEEIIRNTVREIGYNESGLGFKADEIEIINKIHTQSPDIAQGVSLKAPTNLDFESTGAGDQGMMYGFATNETEELMPLPISLAHRLTKRLTEARKKGEIPYLKPDGKAQVTIEYDGETPIRVDTIVVSAQHAASVSQTTIYEDILHLVIKRAIPNTLMDENTKIYINPTGRFVVGGPDGDSGLTGRKIIVDTYGGYCPHGGGAFSGKDATKVDRSASYYARYVCKNIVAAGLAQKCMLEVSYAIGMVHPISLRVSTFNTGTLKDTVLEEIVKKVFDFRPAAIISNLRLREPIYRYTTNYGHFGKPLSPFEACDKADLLLEESKNWK
jgi:S-adenosylmethionine synthetase